MHPCMRRMILSLFACFFAVPATAVALAPLSKPTIKAAIGKAKDGVVAGQSVRVSGTIKPMPQNSTVTLRVFRNGKKVLAKAMILSGSSFERTFATGKPGRYKVRVVSADDTSMKAGMSKAKFFTASYPWLGEGDRGNKVRYLQRRLKKLHYWLTENGYYGGATARAVLAFRKVTGIARTQVADGTLWRKIRHGAGEFKLKHKISGRYVEGDLSRQVLVLARDRKVYKIIHTSSGAPGTPTVLGSFSVYSHSPGYNEKGMYYSVYFHNGYAIHGFASVPEYGASHGCFRIPESNAVTVYNWLNEGDKIFVYP